MQAEASFLFRRDMTGESCVRCPESSLPSQVVARDPHAVHQRVPLRIARVISASEFSPVSRSWGWIVSISEEVAIWVVARASQLVLERRVAFVPNAGSLAS